MKNTIIDKSVELLKKEGLKFSVLKCIMKL